MCPLSGYCDLLKLTPAPIPGDAGGDSSVSTAISRCCTRPKPSPAAAPPRHDTATWTQTRVLLSNTSSGQRKTEKNSCGCAYNVKCCLFYEWIPLLNSYKWWDEKCRVLSGLSRPPEALLSPSCSVTKHPVIWSALISSAQQICSHTTRSVILSPAAIISGYDGQMALI